MVGHCTDTNTYTKKDRLHFTQHHEIHNRSQDCFGLAKEEEEGGLLRAHRGQCFKKGGYLIQ